MVLTGDPISAQDAEKAGFNNSSFLITVLLTVHLIGNLEYNTNE